MRGIVKGGLNDSGGGQWAQDWSAYQTVYDWSGTTVSTPALSYRNVVNITGEGALTFVQSLPFNNLKITIDGVPYIFNTTGTRYSTSGNAISRPIFFKTSLSIDVYNGVASASITGCDYTYLKKTTTPNTTKQSILLAGSRNTVLGETTSLTAVDIVNITGSGYLLGVEFLGYYNTAAGVIYGTVIIDGITKMSARQVFSPVGASFKTPRFDGPIRFTSSLKVQHHTQNAGTTAISKVLSTLD